MGLSFSKTEPHKTGLRGFLLVQHRMINLISTSFYIRKLVSKKRRRMIVGGYDLDMTYITDRILAMSFPAERMRSVYRNPLWQVKSVLDMRHPGQYKVYNLCTEEAYDPAHFHGRLVRCPFDDNHVPPLSMIKELCEDVYSWLSQDPKNVAVIHCMAGKGRTGLMVSAYLVYMGMSAEKAMQLYAEKRTTNNEGVSIPSQRRYVGYWEKLLSFPEGLKNPPEVKLPKPVSRDLLRIRLYDTKNVYSVCAVVSELQKNPDQQFHQYTEVSKVWCREIKKGYQQTDSTRYYYSFVENDDDDDEIKEGEPEAHLVAQMDTESSTLYNKTCLDYYYDQPVKVTGDTRIIIYEKLIGGRLFYACFNTAFITGSVLQFSASDLDKLGMKGRSICGPAFCLELLFGPVNVNNSSFTPQPNDDGGIDSLSD
ncbi:OLC1v1009675C1 [Oldenlandia corymbosa var. corymbosa]|uniref:OLC1v1009675C1 n=1 Tax=Oldenlandia corymbosa var. corymbosa TaxID=529605 RepID=A0AAV1DPG2_OLDCO|nr:OLC1v1009675C1 [Oldenlandia corymbosa var. corymbosa]